MGQAGQRHVEIRPKASRGTTQVRYNRDSLLTQVRVDLKGIVTQEVVTYKSNTRVLKKAR